MTEAGVEAVRDAFPMRLSDETVTARAIRTRSICHVADVLSGPLFQPKEAALEAARISGYRGCLSVPMVRHEQVVGAIFVARRQPGLFSDTQVQLLKTFADQAVIAIENVRLFKETKISLEQQTATADGRLSICGQYCKPSWSQQLDSAMPTRRTLFARKMGASIPPKPTATPAIFWSI